MAAPRPDASLSIFEDSSSRDALRRASQEVSADPSRANHQGRAYRMALRLVDTLSGGVIDVFEFLIGPRQYNHTQHSRVAIHPTADGFHTDRTANAGGIEFFVLDGTTGQWPTGRPALSTDPGLFGGVLGVAADFVGGAVGALFGTRESAPDRRTDGGAELVKLKRIVETFLGVVESPVPVDRLRLEFINPDAPTSSRDTVGSLLYEVVPDQAFLNISRTAGQSGLYRYTLKLAATKRLSGQRPKAKEAARAKRSLLGMLQDALTFMDAFSFDRVFALYEVLLSPLAALASAVESVEGFVRSWRDGFDDFLALPGALVDRLRTALDGVIKAVTGIFGSDSGVAGLPTETPPPDARLNSALEDARSFQVMRTRVLGLAEAALVSAPRASGLDSVGRSAGSRSGVGGQSTPLEAADDGRRWLRPGEQRDGGERRRGPQGSRLIRVRLGQTLVDLLPPGIGLPALLRLNPGLQHPYVDGARMRASGDTTKTIFAGEFVRIPTANGADPVVAHGADPVAQASSIPGTGIDPRLGEAERLFGRDLKVINRCLVLDPVTGDFVTVAGEENLAQRLEHRLRTPMGALYYEPSFGSTLAAELLAGFATDMRLRLAQQAAREAILSDPGIASVEQVLVSADSGVTRVLVEATTISGTPLGRLATAL